MIIFHAGPMYRKTPGQKTARDYRLHECKSRLAEARAEKTAGDYIDYTSVNQVLLGPEPKKQLETI